MENDLTIQLRVLSAGIDKINSAKNAVDGLANSAKTASTRIGNFGKIMESTGSRMHVLGQRMTWMVTVPLLLLANKSIETALEMEKAFVSFSKVFSGTEEDFERLKKSAGEMSVKFGIPIEEVTAVIREFNKTGIESTEELERLADMTAQVSKTFETDLMNAMEATKGLLMGYQLSIDDTYKALAALNIIGDQTAASEQGILDVFKRAAGTARSLGLGYRNLAGAQAALNKNNIEGSVTGTMLNFAMTRMAKPANAAIDAMAKFGINITSTTWKTSTMNEKLEILAKKTQEVRDSGNKLDFANLQGALTELVGRRQISRFNMLLEDMGLKFDNNEESISEYYKSLRVSADETENLRFWLQQLEKIYESSPHKIASLNEQYRLQSAILGNELLPYKVKLMKFLLELLKRFNKLSPETQLWILKITALVAVLGPLLSIFGLMVTGLGFIISALAKVSGLFLLFGKMVFLVVKLVGAFLLANPITLAIMALIALGTVLYFAWINNWFGIKDKTIEIITAIADWMYQKWEGIKKLFIDGGLIIYDSIVESFNLIINYLKNDAWGDFWFAVGAIVSIFESLPIRIAEVLIEVDSLFKKTLTDINNHLAKEVPKIIDTIARGIEKLPDLIAIHLIRLYNNMKEGFSNAYAVAVAIMVDLSDAVYRITLELPGKVKEALSGLVTTVEEVFNSALDKAKEIWEKVKDLFGKAKEKYEEGREKYKYAMGGVAERAQGGLVYAAQGFFPKGRDTIPAMLSPGEMVLNKSQQANMFNMLSGKSQMAGAGGPTVNINVGHLIASRGEQREFARKIKELLTEDENRY